MKIIIIGFLLFSSLISLAQTSDTSFYSVVNLGKIVGQEKTWKPTQSEYHFYYFYNDRGRGEVINATVFTNTLGKVEMVNSNGLDYYKAPYISSFSRIKDSLVSQYNTIRTAEQDTGQYYIYRQSPSSIEIFIKALIQSPIHKVLIQRGDSAELEDLHPYILSGTNKGLKLYLCRINYGKGNSPSYTWLDEKNNFFGNVTGWYPTIKKGYEYLIDTLHSIQETQLIPFYKSIYNKLTDSLPGRLAIQNVNLFDAINAQIIPNRTILVKSGIISIIGSAENIKIPPGFTIIDGKGKTLLPGMWDTHSHYSKADGIDYISGGITHVRDMGNMADIQAIQKNIRLHNIIGPDITYLSGFIDKDDEYHGPVGKLVNSLSEAIKTEHDYHDAGYNQIKLYSSIDTGWVKDMCKEAHKMNMRVAGHIPVHLTASKAVMKGYDEITHFNMVVLNFLSDTIDTRKNRIVPVGQNAYKIDLKSNAVMDFIQLLKKHQTVVEPTMNLYEELFNSSPGDTVDIYKPVLKWMKESDRKNIKVTSFIDDTTKIPVYKESYKRMLQMLKMFYDNDISLLAGTDGGTQLALQLELELYVKAGIPANEVLRIATYIPAKIFNLTTKIGSVKENRLADFILVDGNPVNNISDIRNVFMVVTDHSLYYPKKLYKYADWESYYY